MMGELPDAEDSEIDYEFMYAHVPKENGYKGQLHQVIVGSTTLETQIGQLVETSLRELPETTRHLARLAKALVSRKLTALREAKIIDGVLCSDLLIVFRVRNQFAHSVAILPNSVASAFEYLRDIRISNTFFQTLPNDAAKFCLVVSHCFHQSMRISKRLDPNSVLDLELVGDITPIEE